MIRSNEVLMSSPPEARAETHCQVFEAARGSLNLEAFRPTYPQVFDE